MFHPPDVLLFFCSSSPATASRMTAGAAASAALTTQRSKQGNRHPTVMVSETGPCSGAGGSRSGETASVTSAPSTPQSAAQSVGVRNAGARFKTPRDN